jgi:hypothetical protein
LVEQRLPKYTAPMVVRALMIRCGAAASQHGGGD